MARICESRVTLKEINIVDEEITYLLNAARKYVEGPKSGIPYSQQKQMKLSTILCIKGYIKKKKRGIINKKALERRKRVAKINLEGKEIEELKELYRNLVKYWE